MVVLLPYVSAGCINQHVSHTKSEVNLCCSHVYLTCLCAVVLFDLLHLRKLMCQTQVILMLGSACQSWPGADFSTTTLKPRVFFYQQYIRTMYYMKNNWSIVH